MAELFNRSAHSAGPLESLRVSDGARCRWGQARLIGRHLHIDLHEAQIFGVILHSFGLVGLGQIRIQTKPKRTFDAVS